MPDETCVVVMKIAFAVLAFLFSVANLRLLPAQLFPFYGYTLLRQAYRKAYRRRKIIWSVLKISGHLRLL